MATSLHDHHILELSIDATARTIRLRTAFPERSGPDFANVVFERVEAYTFRGDALGTILYDVELIDAIELYRQYAAEMQATYANTGGHAPWTRSDSSAERF
jgi:hypothetical protein